jgi:hypothetical protein
MWESFAVAVEDADVIVRLIRIGCNHYDLFIKSGLGRELKASGSPRNENASNSLECYPRRFF